MISKATKVVIHIDGGSRGNPGPAAFGIVFSDSSGETIKNYADYMGEATNNEAEYTALIFALKKAKSLFGKDKIKETNFEIKSDSQLLISQMTGKYKIEAQKIQKLFLKAWNLKIDFGNLDFIFISRGENKMADKLVNKVLDAKSKNQKLF